MRLPFVCSSKRKEAKEKTPGLRVGAKRAELLPEQYQVLGPKGAALVNQYGSDHFGDPQTGWPHRRRAPETLRPCASRSLHTGPEYRRVTHSSELVRLHTGIKAIGYVLVGLRLRLIRPTPIVTLSER